MLPLSKISLNFKTLLLSLMLCYPLLWVAFCFAFALKCTLYLGYWPEPNQPDPQFVPFQNQLNALHFASFLVPVSSILCVFTIAMRKLREMYRIQVLANILGWILIIVFTFVPKYNFVSWIMD
jgi:hypothetical protein